MELRHLRGFIALAETKQFTAAARKIHIVQSGLSVAIKEMEEELGTQLVHRSTRKVELTDAGVQFLNYARSSIAVLEAGVHAVRAEDGVVRGRLRLGILQSLRPYIDIPALLARFRKDYPEIEFAVRTLNTPSIPSEVKDGVVDLSFHALLGRSTWPGLVATPFAEDELVVICSSSHSLATRRRPRTEQLAGAEFVDLSPERTLRVLVDQGFASAGLYRNTVYEVSDVESLLDLVAGNLGVAVVPSRVAASSAQRDRLKLIPLAAFGMRVPRWRIMILTPAAHGAIQANPAIDLFLQAAKAFASS